MGSLVCLLDFSVLPVSTVSLSLWFTQICISIWFLIMFRSVSFLYRRALLLGFLLFRSGPSVTLNKIFLEKNMTISCRCGCKYKGSTTSPGIGLVRLCSWKEKGKNQVFTWTSKWEYVTKNIRIRTSPASEYFIRLSIVIVFYCTYPIRQTATICWHTKSESESESERTVNKTRRVRVVHLV